LRDGQLKSTSQLRKEGKVQHAIGFLPLGEPPDYLDYVMFAGFDKYGGASSCEIVVNSHIQGKPCFDINAPYQPQARMYFDARKIIEDGLAVRDGTHSLKVFGALPLEGYHLRTIFAEDVTLPPGKEHWTPALFTEAANALFFREIGASPLTYEIFRLQARDFKKCGGIWNMRTRLIPQTPRTPR
jgi:hypothetical protein